MSLSSHPGLDLIAFSAVPGTPTADGLRLLASLVAPSPSAADRGRGQARPAS
jgi:hypothetical protein